MTINKILILGNLGYIGPVLTKYLNSLSKNFCSFYKNI